MLYQEMKQSNADFLERVRKMEKENGELLLENRTLKTRLEKVDETKVEATIKDLRSTASTRLAEKEAAQDREKKALQDVERIKGEMTILRETHEKALREKDKEIATLRKVVNDSNAVKVG